MPTTSDAGEGSVCQRARSVLDRCYAQGPAESGVTFNLDVAQCESGVAETRQQAQCIVDHTSMCNCIEECMTKLKC